jgi:hypothetical protein
LQGFFSLSFTTPFETNVMKLLTEGIKIFITKLVEQNPVKKVHIFDCLTLSHMASEVSFLVWQGGQAVIPVRTTLAKGKMICG